MAKQKLEVEESKVNYTSDIMLDDSELANESFSEMEIEKSVFKEIKNKKEINQTTDKEMINCLRQERILVRHIPKEGGMISNPKHIFWYFRSIEERDECFNNLEKQAIVI